MRMKTSLTITLLPLAFLVTNAQAAEINATSSSFGVIQDEFEATGTAGFSASNGNADRVGSGGSPGAQRVNNPVLGFTLPNLAIGETVSSVEFTIQLTNAPDQGSPTFDAVVSLMNYDAIGDFSATDYSNDVSSLGNGTLVGTFNNTDTTSNGTLSFSLTGLSLTLFQSFYGGDNIADQSDIWFRISTDKSDWAFTADPGVNTDDNTRYNFLDDGSGDVTRGLKITTVPEPSSYALIAGSLALLAIARRRR